MSTIASAILCAFVDALCSSVPQRLAGASQGEGGSARRRGGGESRGGSSNFGDGLEADVGYLAGI